MHSFVLTNHKGGVAKTITSANFAYGLARLLEKSGAISHNVLLIDTDSQAHATLITTGRNDYGRNDSLYAVATAERSHAAVTKMNCIVQSQWSDSLHVLPATPLLDIVERELVV